MSFRLKNAPSKFQKIMHETFLPFTHFIIVYIDDILIFSENIDKHQKHLQIFYKKIIQNGLVILKKNKTISSQYTIFWI